MSNSSGETAYLVQRSADGDNWSQIASIPPDSHGYTDTTADGQTWHYRVVAQNDGGPPAPATPFR